jgi:hypothetical protein
LGTLLSASVSFIAMHEAANRAEGNYPHWHIAHLHGQINKAKAMSCFVQQPADNRFALRPPAAFYVYATRLAMSMQDRILRHTAVFHSGKIAGVHGDCDLCCGATLFRARAEMVFCNLSICIKAGGRVVILCRLIYGRAA